MIRVFREKDELFSWTGANVENVRPSHESYAEKVGIPPAELAHATMYELTREGLEKAAPGVRQQALVACLYWIINLDYSPGCIGDYVSVADFDVTIYEDRTIHMVGRQHKMDS